MAPNGQEVQTPSIHFRKLMKPETQNLLYTYLSNTNRWLRIYTQAICSSATSDEKCLHSNHSKKKKQKNKQKKKKTKKKTKKKKKLNYQKPEAGREKQENTKENSLCGS